MKTINYDGIEISYDETVLKKWSFSKRIMNQATQFDAMDELLLGQSDVVAEQLGDSMEKMTDLLARIVVVEGGTAKN